MDYSITSSDLIFSATTSSQIVAIPILDDTVLESSETIHMTLTSVDPAAILNPAGAVITIEDDDGQLYYFICGYVAECSAAAGIL